MSALMRVCATSALVTLVILSSCSKAPRETDPVNPLTEAYQLMDRGENAKAIELLEPAVANPGPHQEEARLLLASAYAGRAGLDIYTLHGSFEDILFSKPLDSKLWGENGGEGQSHFNVLFDNTVKVADGAAAPLQRSAKVLDLTLYRMQLLAVVLNRFPKIEEKNWPLIERSIELLQTMRSGKEVSLYRLFVTIAYMREFLVRKVMSDPNFGTRQWLCRQDPIELADGLNWLANQMMYVNSDFKVAFPERTSPFMGAVKGLLEASDILSGAENPEFDSSHSHTVDLICSSAEKGEK